MATFTITIKTVNYSQGYFPIQNPNRRIYARSQSHTVWGARNIYTIFGETLKIERVKLFIQEITHYVIKTILEDHENTSLKNNGMLTEAEQIFRLVYKLAEGDLILQKVIIACASTINECLKTFNQLLLPVEDAYDLITWEGSYSAYIDLSQDHSDSPVSLTMLRNQGEGLTMRVNEPVRITL